MTHFFYFWQRFKPYKSQIYFFFKNIKNNFDIIN